MDPAKVARGLSLWVFALGCSPARATAPAAAPSVDEDPVVVGRLPSFATPVPTTPSKMSPGRYDGEPRPECSEEEAEGRELIPAQCSPTCTGHEVFVRYCAEGRWNSKTLEANCALCPTKLPPALAACRIDHTIIEPSELSSTDGCKLELSCNNEKLLAECDGENDGTNTSLCTCRRNGVESRSVSSNPIQGEAPESCLRAAEKCLTILRR
jgi:hypothetical protein